MKAINMEAEFKRQTSNYRPRASFKRGQRLMFRRKLANENRSMVWVHKDRHEEIARFADATGLTMSAITDAMIRFALSNAVVINDEGHDVELKAYLDSILGVQETTDEMIKALEEERENQTVAFEGAEDATDQEG